jgi:hypothetical protein
MQKNAIQTGFHVHLKTNSNYCIDSESQVPINCIQVVISPSLYRILVVSETYEIMKFSVTTEMNCSVLYKYKL